MRTVVKIENLSKQYRFGVIGHGTLIEDLQSWWARVRGQEDPNEKIVEHAGPGQDGQRFWALKDVSLEIAEGERVGIIGRNGAGKSTLLKIISRVTKPTKGQVKVRGRVASLLEVGTGFHPELTGRENIYLNGSILGMSKAEIRKKFDDIVYFSDVEKFIDTPVKRYSSGMYVRLAFSIAAHLEPEILIVDEVLAVGDAEFQGKCLGKMEDVGKEGRTVLFVSHNMASISALCPKCIYLEAGRIRNMGSASDIILQYLGDFKRTQRVSLAERTDRKGNGRVKITGLRFLDTTTHRPLETIVSGQDVYIEVAYKSYISPYTLLKRFNIGLGFFTTLGQFVMVLNSEMASRAFESLPSEGRIYCHIPRFALMPGVFHVKPTLQVSGTMADQIENALVINVEPGDFFGSGIPNDYRRQGVYVQHSWSAEVPSA